jgi:Hydroxyethylthiazole kinase, sugar kinase family
MFVAAKAAEKRGIPIILDPVGAGATSLRTKTAHRMIQELSISVLKGNAGEIGTLAGKQAQVRGVDSGGVTGDPTDITCVLAERLGCTVVMSGPTDIISDGSRTLLCENGHPPYGTYIRDRMHGCIGYWVLCRSHSELSLCIRHRYCCVWDCRRAGCFRGCRSWLF